MLYPMFISVSPEAFARIAESADRVAEAVDLMEDAPASTFSLGLEWFGVQAAVGDTAMAAVQGAQVWAEDPPVGGASPEEVTRIVDDLAAVDRESAEDVGAEFMDEVGLEPSTSIIEALDSLQEFYQGAAYRGEAVIVVFN
ncbi:MAG: DUF1877 family protein [Corynebacterium sp.]|uniref:DUF1877 family protein n=1 Tax=Corynebacterium sp. TaxID=1720 RepID=UPI0026E017E1|nr:DUF1877 family protein [Corynebacterium sp.]MDO5669800.1 DUF1877 family protein [Corynebacterium sp.]